MGNLGGYLLAEVMLWLMYAMLVVALVAAVGSAVRFWLKTTDGLIVSSLILILIAACGVVYGVSGVNRKIEMRS